MIHFITFDTSQISKYAWKLTGLENMKTCTWRSLQMIVRSKNMERRDLQIQRFYSWQISHSVVFASLIWLSVFWHQVIFQEGKYIKSCLYLHYVSLYIYIVCTFTVREIMRFASGMQTKERSKHKLLILSLYLSPCQQLSICLE